MSHTIEALISTLQTPDIYPHKVTGNIELVQTHVSYVLLTGDYAYKLKKSVNFGFLDFSTLEKRQHFCEVELRLNSELTKDVYLNVVSITYDGKDYAIDGQGEVVEYAVKMRQFPQEALLSGMFQAGTLVEENMVQLGKAVAAFHGTTRTNDYIRGFGEIAKIRQAIDENYAQTAGYIGRVQTQERFEQTKDFTDNFFASREDIFASRRDQNKIRECHGDLHLRNICLWQDKIQLFDRIEFNEPFRFVDTMYDVAFTVMDLDARGAQKLGNAFLNTYVEETGDWEGLQVLPLYLSRQAYVRAKVTSFLLDDAAIAAEAKQAAAKTASEYYELAWQYTQLPKGKVVMMSGLSGSGKSTVARRCARIWNAIQIRSDALRKHLAGIALDATGDNSLYSQEMNEKTYARLTELGILLAQQGFTVILDAKFDRTAQRQKVIEACQAAELPYQILYCQAPTSLLETRLKNRTDDISDATADLLQAQIDKAESFTDEESLWVRSIDTTQNIDAIISYL
ncbi:AAA family ATPase [[Limnothrix rosea] IAM M-220]|uniref:bifunctional aminoglycoside phosphotransferase/ATP-binding protein n=1 Tax=[Limnothrix rosea] IAM M-220 TaxID=454133 RepID=UPI000965A068|nr:bifunctional aminoglycoside phosphotransferase/ATP-binding protein [[Limnothrix rosea] IAM M-220]OKH13827.1 adenylyl-sulfate kinase [[Limnothrix rosea] IAM M-220]